MGRGSDEDNMKKCLKWCMIVANFLILIGGFTILAIGIWTLVDKSFMGALMMNSLYLSAAYILIITGCITVILTILGCLGAMQESKCILLTYFVLVLLIFIVLIIGGILGYVFRHQIEANLKPGMAQIIREYDPNKPHSPMTSAWDATQKYLRCCGLVTEDMTEKNKPWLAWKKNILINSGNADSKVPASCCQLDVNGKPTDCATSSQVNPDLIYRADCYVSGLIFIKDHSALVAGVAIGIAAVMVTGMILSITLFKLI